MGEGEMTTDMTPEGKQAEWYFPKPDSLSNYIHSKICQEHQ